MKKSFLMLLCLVLALSPTGRGTRSSGNGFPSAGGAELTGVSDAGETEKAQDTQEYESGADRPTGTGRAIRSHAAYANWTEDSRIYSGARNRDKLLLSSVQHLPVYKFDTKADLDSFRAGFGEILTMDCGYDEVPSFDECTAAFDDSFFETSSLVLAYVTAGSGSYRFGVSEVRCEDQSFCMVVEELSHPECVTCDMAGWFVMVEAEKADLEACLQFDAWLERPAE